MTDIKRMKKLFDDLGVAYTTSKGTTPVASNLEIRADSVSSGQTYYYFDRATGEYLGLEWDEMGVWEPSKRKGR